MSDNHTERIERTTSPRRRATDRPPAVAAERVHPLLQLQRQIGNEQVARLLAQRAGEEEEEPLQAKHDTTLQRADDEEEEPLQAKHDTTLQRADDEEEEPLQAKLEVGREGGPVPAATASMIQAARGGGQPLDSSTRVQMERAFDTGFGDVRLHADSSASDLNQRLGAQAFTTGTDIFVRDDAYQPDTDSGTRLLGHELAHVVQQRSMPSSEGMGVRPAGDAYEQAADAIADRVTPSVSAAQRQVDRSADSQED